MLRCGHQKQWKKIFFCLLKIDNKSVIDGNENERASRRYAVVFRSDREIYDDMSHCLTNINASFII